MAHWKAPGNNNDTGTDKKLEEGSHLVQVSWVITENKDHTPKEIGGVPAFSILFTGIAGNNEGQKHWENFFLEGSFSGRTIQLLKAAGLIDWEEVVEELDFEPKDLKGKIVGIQLVKNDKGYTNCVNIMTEEQFQNEQDIPF